MNVIMAGMDYTLASVDIREKFSFTKSTIQAIYNEVLKKDKIFGAVLISTCNRTELYLSCEDYLYINPFELLCGIVGYDYERYRKLHTLRTGEDVIIHLCKVACGVKSQIWGEDQILTQVKNAIETAREMNASDSTLEVMFRTAITAAKKVKSTLKLSSIEGSVVISALRIIRSRDAIKRALVIGNGEIGRLMSSTLINNGYDTTITLRQYRYGSNIVPLGVRTVDYSERYKELCHCDVVISATLSPHYTIKFDEVNKISRYPHLFIDLAVPRDIDPCIKSLNQVELYDVDSICVGEVNKNHTEQLARVDEIIQKYILDFYRWYEFKKRRFLA